MNDDDAVIEAARAIRPCLDTWPIPGVLNFATHSPDDRHRDRNSGSVRLQRTVPNRLFQCRRVLARRMSAPPPPSVTAVGVLPLPGEPPR
jgi:hypothetical protein